MQCYVCGSFFDDNQPYCPVCGTLVRQAEPVQYQPMPPLEVPTPAPAVVVCERSPYRKPHIALRIGMQLLSLVLCMLLCVSLVAVVFIADANMLTSSGGIKQLISAVLLPRQTPSAPRPMAAAVVLSADSGQIDPSLLYGTLPQDEGGLPDASGDSSVLVDILYNTIQDMMGDEMPITKDQLQDFMENSTVSDYIAEKAAGFTDDILSGTENTQITAEELTQLMEENKSAIEQAFDVTITDEQMTEFKANISAVMEEQDINNTIRTEINTALDAATSEMEEAGIPLSQIMEGVRLLTQDSVLYGAIGICVLLILLLCGANFYNIPAGMTWAAVPCIVLGGILSLPIALLQLMPSVLGELAGFASMVNVLAPIHYAVPITGLVLLIGSIVWRVVRSYIFHNRDVTI